jgi:hypothetical protein
VFHCGYANLTCFAAVLLLLGFLLTILRTTTMMAAMQHMGSQRTRFYLTRADVIPAKYSPWVYLYTAQSDGAFMSCMSLTVAAFQGLLAQFTVKWNKAETRGRPAQLDAAGALGLALHWLSSSTQQAHLCLIFGVVPSTLSDTLKGATRTLLQCLEENPLAAVRWPTLDQKREYADMISAKFPGMNGFFGWIDGSLFWIQVPSDNEEQEAMYSGRKKRHCVNNLFVWLPDGCIAYELHNAEGRQHDLTLAKHRLIPFMERELNRGHEFALIGDVGFQVPRHPTLHKLITTPLKTNQFSRNPLEAQRQTAVSNVVTAARQVCVIIY